MEEHYEYFKYFIENYFNWSMDYSDLDSLMTDYIRIEDENHILSFKEEIKKLQLLSDPYEKIVDMVFEYGTRGMSNEKAKNMLGLLVKRFLEEL